MTIFIVLSLSFQCWLDIVSYASSIEVYTGWRFEKHRATPKRQLTPFIHEIMKKSKIDSRVLALSWIESRIRPKIHRGDRGKACGIFQIHARYSYPYLRRKQGFNGWVENEQTKRINSECYKLESIRYSIDTMERLLNKMDDRELHPCHHNSGFRGRCNTWYKQRLDYWMAYFTFANFICSEDVTEVIRRRIYEP